MLDLAARIEPKAPSRSIAALPKARGEYAGNRGVSLDPRQAFPYEAASWFSRHLGDWFPWIKSPDAEINVNRDRMVARVRDLDRNDGWARGLVKNITDEAIGGEYRLVAKPDYRALQAWSKSFDVVWADEFRRAVEAQWRGFANGTGHWNDVERKQTMTQMLRLGLRHKIIDGENITWSAWLPERIRLGHAKYATAFQIIDPDRLSNPYTMVDTAHRRGGVEIDDHGAPVGYHFRRAHQNDWYQAVEANIWDYVPRETDWGRPIVLHDFDLDRAGQNRGLSELAPALARLKMLAKYDAAELDAAIINAVFAAFVQSPYDPAMVGDALTADEDGLGRYQDLRSEFHRSGSIKIDGAVVPILMPGETINTVSPTRPSTAFADFEHAILRNVASLTGRTAEQVSSDWSKTNYSSARGALVQAWKTMQRRRQDFEANSADPVYGNWLEEAFEVDDLPMPRGAPGFAEARNAYAACDWIGPGRGWIDPIKEPQGAILRMDAGFSTLQKEAAENSGLDWEEVLDQRQLEVAAFHARGLKPPTWANEAIAAQETDQRPQPA